MTKSFNEFKMFFDPSLVHLSNSEGKTFFPENPALSRTTSQNLQKLMIQFQENTRTDKRLE